MSLAKHAAMLFGAVVATTVNASHTKFLSRGEAASPTITLNALPWNTPTPGTPGTKGDELYAMCEPCFLENLPENGGHYAIGRLAVVNHTITKEYVCAWSANNVQKGETNPGKMPILDGKLNLWTYEAQCDGKPVSKVVEDGDAYKLTDPSKYKCAPLPTSTSGQPNSYTWIPKAPVPQTKACPGKAGTPPTPPTPVAQYKVSVSSRDQTCSISWKNDRCETVTTGEGAHGTQCVFPYGAEYVTITNQKTVGGGQVDLKSANGKFYLTGSDGACPKLEHWKITGAISSSCDFQTDTGNEHGYTVTGSIIVNDATTPCPAPPVSSPSTPSLSELGASQDKP